MDQVKDILRKEVTVNVNWRNRNMFGRTALHVACQDSHVAVASLLLAHPHINVNQRDSFGETPLLRGCGNLDIVRLLLRDPRVDLTMADKGGHSPFVWIVKDESLPIVEWWIASGREVKLGKPGNAETDAIMAAKSTWFFRAQMVTLLENFKQNPEEVRHAVRSRLGWYTKEAAEVFALLVFLSDGLLELRPKTRRNPAARVFRIARRLPLELQMILSYRIVGSAKEVVRGKDSEEAFKDLATRLHPRD